MIDHSWDNIWETVFIENEWGRYPSENLIQFVARNYYSKDRPSVKILEVGCGPGANIWYLSREKFDAYGVDGSKTAIERARKRLAEEHLKASFYVADIMSLPFNDGFFDCVIDNECLYANNVENTKKILKEISRVLRPNGLFYSRTFKDDMFVGNRVISGANLEFREVNIGPLAGKGFVRLIDKVGIDNLYTQEFDIVSLDTLEYTSGNGNVKTSEWIIIMKKK